MQSHLLGQPTRLTQFNAPSKKKCWVSIHEQPPIVWIVHVLANHSPAQKARLAKSVLTLGKIYYGTGDEYKDYRDNRFEVNIEDKYDGIAIYRTSLVSNAGLNHESHVTLD